jgi:hypothetical protein
MRILEALRVFYIGIFISTEYVYLSYLFDIIKRPMSGATSQKKKYCDEKRLSIDGPKLYKVAIGIV